MLELHFGLYELWREERRGNSILLFKSLALLSVLLPASKRDSQNYSAFSQTGYPHPFFFSAPPIAGENLHLDLIDKLFSALRSLQSFIASCRRSEGGGNGRGEKEKNHFSKAVLFCAVFSDNEQCESAVFSICTSNGPINTFDWLKLLSFKEERYEEECSSCIATCQGKCIPSLLGMIRKECKRINGLREKLC